MWYITIILGVAAALFVGFSILIELAKIRKALEHMAYKKEVHEIIETDYDPVDGQTDKAGEAEAEDVGVEKPAPRPVRRYRKIKIKVIEEE